MISGCEFDESTNHDLSSNGHKAIAGALPLNILIVHAHPEPQSFSSSLANTASESLQELGHTVVVSDLYRQNFSPVSGRHNFTTIRDPDYFKQQQEERYATEMRGFALDLEAEIRKLEAADLLIFSFPLWWFGMPGILKGWVDRVFAMGRVYGGPKLYESGLGAKRNARAMVLITTGSGPVAFSGRGANPAFTSILAPIQHGIFWFNGFLPMEPFVAWSAARVTDEDRRVYLGQLKVRLKDIFNESPINLPPLADFPQFGVDAKKRFKVVIRRKQSRDEFHLARIPLEETRLAGLRRSGFILDDVFSPPDAEIWRGFLTVRAESQDEVSARLKTLPLAHDLDFEIFELM